jgi:hypothetical protein
MKNNNNFLANEYFKMVARLSLSRKIEGGVAVRIGPVNQLGE